LQFARLHIEHASDAALEITTLAHVTGTDLEVIDTGASTQDGPSGAGIAVAGSLDLDRFRVSNSSWAGLGIGEDAQLSLRNGTVRDNAIGIAALAPTADGVHFDPSVAFSNNTTAYLGSAPYMPPAPPDLGFLDPGP